MKDKKDKQCRFIFTAALVIFTKGANISGGHCSFSNSNVLFCQTQTLASDDTQTCQILGLLSCLENSEINSKHCYKNILLGNRNPLLVNVCYSIRHK